MGQFRRGFVTYVQNVAIEERRDLGIGLFEPLNPWALADAHGVPVVDIRDLADEPAAARAVRAFITDRQELFSAALLPIGSGCLIVENGAHASTRRVASVTHEMSHLLLEHEFHPSMASGECRGTTSEREREADRLAMELLIPRQAALTHARRGVTDIEIADRLGISPRMAAMCMNRSGARKQAMRERGRRRG